jgi:hypothetical protein
VDSDVLIPWPSQPGFDEEPVCREVHGDEHVLPATKMAKKTNKKKNNGKANADQS